MDEQTKAKLRQAFEIVIEGSDDTLEQTGPMAVAICMALLTNRETGAIPQAWADEALECREYSEDGAGEAYQNSIAILLRWVALRSAEMMEI